MPPTDPSRSSLEDFAHDLRSALTVVKMHGQALARRIRTSDPVDREQALAHLRQIDEAVNRAVQHVADLVERHRAEDGSG